MEINSQQSKFEGWAIVDALGHQRSVGYVTTEHFGQTVLFKVVSPEREARTRKLEPGDYIGNGWGYVPFQPPTAWHAAEGAAPQTERYIGAGSIYMLTPASREKVIDTLDEIAQRPFVGIVDADGKPIEKPTREEEEMPY